MPAAGAPPPDRARGMLSPREPSKIGRVFNRLTDLPSLPRVVEKLLRLPENACTRDFADLIATDQGLSAKVLRLVNSAFYSLRAPISSIRTAAGLNTGTSTPKPAEKTCGWSWGEKLLVLSRLKGSFTKTEFPCSFQVLARFLDHV